VETPKVELLREEKKPPKKPKFVKTKPEIKGIPNPLERQTKEITDLPEEFVIADKATCLRKKATTGKRLWKMPITISIT